MPGGVYKRTKEHNRHISEALKRSTKNNGKIPWNKGLTAATDVRIQSMINKLKQIYVEHPELRERSAKLMRDMHNRVWRVMTEEKKREIIEKQRQKKLLFYTNPKSRKMISDANKLSYARNPERAKNHSRIMRELYKNPEYKKRHLLKVMPKCFAGRQVSWDDPERKDARLKNWIAACRRRPSDIEVRLIDILDKYDLPYKYVGLGEVILGGKNPDFINVNGEKKIIELFGNLWHEKYEEAERKLHFRQYGYETLILWGRDFRKMSDDEIVEVIKRFK